MKTGVCTECNYSETLNYARIHYGHTFCGRSSRAILVNTNYRNNRWDVKTVYRIKIR